MLLAIDTSGKQGGIALARYDGEFAIIAAEATLEGGQYSSRLLRAIVEALASLSASIADVSAIAVITGPGSFTGLRVGLSTVKGLCEARPTPIVPVTMLELLASLTSASDVTALLDAGRREIYVGAFTQDDGIYAPSSESLLPLSAFSKSALTVTPDATIASVTGAVQVPYPSAADLAQYGARKLARGMTVTADDLDAHYIRRSDAEIALQR